MNVLKKAKDSSKTASALIKHFWTGSKRVGYQEFVDEHGIPIKSLDCFFSEKELVDQIFKFPSQMTAVVSDKEVVWQNSIPGKTTGPIGRCLCYKRFVQSNAIIRRFFGPHFRLKLCLIMGIGRIA